MTATDDYLHELQERRRQYLEGIGELQAAFKRRDRRPPGEFKDSSFLYLRSYPADIGNRPFSNIPFWRSPDIRLTPVTSVGPYTTELIAGETYRIRCTLRNRGDLAVPSAKVELFLTDPTLGFDTRFATRLTGIGTVPTAWVNPDGSDDTEFIWTVPPTESGHKCLFARAFSFSPLDLPADDFALDPCSDRHIAQQNLNIVGQSQAFSFNLVHAANALVRIELRPLDRDALLGLDHPVTADVTPAKEVPRRGWGRLAELELTEPGAEEVVIAEHTSEGVIVAAKGREDGEPRRSSFTMNVPDLGLSPGEAVALDITSAEDERTTGGITLVIVGGRS